MSLSNPASSLVHPVLRAAEALHLGVVYASGGVRFATVAMSLAEVIQRVAEYVRLTVQYELWPRDASRFERLFRRGDHQGAVDLYFAAVGQRWDRQWLWTAVTEPHGRCGVFCVSDSAVSSCGLRRRA